MEADFDVGFLRLLLHAGVGPYVEAEDDRMGGLGQQDVGVGDRPAIGAEDMDLDLVVGELLEVGFKGFRGPVGIGFDDDVEVFDFAGVDEVIEVF